MADIGVRELKTKASEIIRSVKEQRSQYIITLHGRPVAKLVPIEDVQPSTETSGMAAPAWDELERLGREISRG